MLTRVSPHLFFRRDHRGPRRRGQQRAAAPHGGGVPAHSPLVEPRGEAGYEELVGLLKGFEGFLLGVAYFSSWNVSPPQQRNSAPFATHLCHRPYSNAGPTLRRGRDGGRVGCRQGLERNGVQVNKDEMQRSVGATGLTLPRQLPPTRRTDVAALSPGPRHSAGILQGAQGEGVCRFEDGRKTKELKVMGSSTRPMHTGASRLRRRLRSDPPGRFHRRSLTPGMP